jgi:DNA adenine methylase
MKPFLKWAGGKGQLLAQLAAFFPPALKSGGIRRYVEPFIGSGAVFFRILQSYPVEECLIADSNLDLILIYQTIQQDVEGLIEVLAEIEANYLPLDEPARRDFYYQVRSRYNHRRTQFDALQYETRWIERSAQTIFLNRTGYNGLFRLNSQGEFNVPFGRYKNPRILDVENLRAVARLLNGVQIEYSDFTAIEPFVDEKTFVYFDPPYRPISATAHFTSYSKVSFNDDQQLRLAAFYRALDRKGARLMLSNSDPRSINPADDFFERAYAGFRIERLRASRNINSDPKKRGPISEILVLNYP